MDIRVAPGHLGPRKLLTTWYRKRYFVKRVHFYNFLLLSLNLLVNSSIDIQFQIAKTMRVRFKIE